MSSSALNSKFKDSKFKNSKVKESKTKSSAPRSSKPRSSKPQRRNHGLIILLPAPTDRAQASRAQAYRTAAQKAPQKTSHKTPVQIPVKKPSAKHPKLGSLIAKPFTSYSKLCLQGRRVEIRPFRVADYKACRDSHEARNESVNRYDEPLPVAMSPDINDFRERLRRYRAHAHDRHHFVFGIWERKTGRFIGQVDLFTFNRQLRWGNLGYHVQNQFFGKGYAAEASKLALEAAFRHLDFHRVEASMELKNAASRKIPLKIGMEYEGKRKKFFSEGGGIDVLVFAANAIDFEKPRGKKR